MLKFSLPWDLVWIFSWKCFCVTTEEI